MTPRQFRSHKFLPHQWRKELETNGILQLVMEVLYDDHPDRHPPRTDIKDDLSPIMAAYQLGETKGYSKVLSMIRFLATPEQAGSPLPEPTYQKEEVNAY
jgi:hypothetical protein